MSGLFLKLIYQGAGSVVHLLLLKCVIHHEMVTVTCESASLKSSADVKLDPITTVADVVTIDLTGGTFDVSGATLDGVVVVDVKGDAEVVAVDGVVVAVTCDGGKVLTKSCGNVSLDSRKQARDVQQREAD